MNLTKIWWKATGTKFTHSVFKREKNFNFTMQFTRFVKCFQTNEKTAKIIKMEHASPLHFILMNWICHLSFQSRAVHLFAINFYICVNGLQQAIFNINKTILPPERVNEPIELHLNFRHQFDNQFIFYWLSNKMIYQIIRLI